MRIIFLMETSKVSVQPTEASKGLKQVMRQHPLFFFFLMSYAFSWIVLIPYVLSVWGILKGDFSIPVHPKAVRGTDLGRHHHDQHHRRESRLASLAATP